jgi:hypothetical protein
VLVGKTEADAGGKRYTLLNERGEMKGIYDDGHQGRRKGDTELREDSKRALRRHRDPSEHAREMAGGLSTD